MKMETTSGVITAATSATPVACTVGGCVPAQTRVRTCSLLYRAEQTRCFLLSFVAPCHLCPFRLVVYASGAAGNEDPTWCRHMCDDEDEGNQRRRAVCSRNGPVAYRIAQPRGQTGTKSVMARFWQETAQMKSNRDRDHWTGLNNSALTNQRSVCCAKFLQPMNTHPSPQQASMARYWPTLSLLHTIGPYCCSCTVFLVQIGQDWLCGKNN